MSSLNCKLAGLAFLFKLSGFSDVTKHFLVKKAMKVYRKDRLVPDSRRPVSFATLGCILEQSPIVCSSYEAVLFKTAFVLGFFGALCIGELVSASKWGVGGLAFDDVLVQGDKVHLRIQRSKTDQREAHVEWGVVPRSLAFPVRIVHE